MTLAFRVASMTMVLALLLGGPLAPLASAQQTSRPDVFRETVKADDPRAGEQADVTFNETFYDVTAGVMTAFLVPGRAITCGLAGGISVLVLLATFGSGYRAASGVLNEGCGGKWIVRGEDLVPDRVPIAPTADRK